MARLPQPGGDSGNWGSILNDYLAQSHKSDGTVKDNSISASALAPNSVTNTALAPDSVNATTIADGSITEALLANAVQTKLNAPSSIADGSITSAQLVATVQTSLAKADSALQSDDIITKANDTSVVHIAGNETITGAKNFTGGVTVGSANVVVSTDSRLTDNRTPIDDSVTTIKIKDATITEAKFSNTVQTKLNTIGTLADSSITTAKLADSAVSRTKLSADVQSSIPIAASASNGVAYAIVDQTNSYGLIISNDGSLGYSRLDSDTAQRTATQLSPLLSTSAPTQFKSSYSALAHSMVSGPDIVAIGDSLTAGAGGSGTTYGAVLASATGKTVRTSAVGGESSIAINARQGGQPYLLLPQGNQMPASGGVTVSLSLPGGLVAWPLLQGTGTGGTMRGALAGIAGVLTLTQPSNPGSAHNGTDFYTFTRDTAGSVVTVNRPQAFYIEFNQARRGDIYSYWYGRNNLSQPAQILGDINSSIAYQTALDKRYVVLTVLNAAGEITGSANYLSITALNTQLLQTYGRRCIDVRKYLIEYGLADAVIAPTAQDTTDISNDVIPSSLRVDSVHLNSAGYTVVGNLVARRLNELGWI